MTWNPGGTYNFEYDTAGNTADLVNGAGALSLANLGTAAGQKFAVHLTALSDFKPVAAGQARVEFTPETGGQPMVLSGPKPSRPATGSSSTRVAAPARRSPWSAARRVTEL